MSPLALQYAEAFDVSCQLDPDSWFEDGTPQEQLDLLNGIVAPEQVAETMLLEGETCWHHLGWWHDVLTVLEDWAQDGHLIRVRMVASWLLSTVPTCTPDPDTSNVLQLLAEGQFCEAFPPLSCAWPAKAEAYLKNLQWAMYEAAEFAAMDQAADIKTALFRRWGEI